MSDDLNAYGINPYGAVIEVEQAVETLREGVETDDPEAVEQALAFFDDTVPDLKRAVRVRYSGNTDWIPFDAERTTDGRLLLTEYDADDSRRVRRRCIDPDDIPTDGDSE